MQVIWGINVQPCGASGGATEWTVLDTNGAQERLWRFSGATLQTCYPADEPPGTDGWVTMDARGFDLSAAVAFSLGYGRRL